MSSRFLDCLPFVLVQEGRPGTKPLDWLDDQGHLSAKCWGDPRNFSNDAHDPGAETFCGIIQREYTAFRKRQGLLSQDVRRMTVDEGQEIYHDGYWEPKCKQLPFGLDLSYFDADVNEGEHEATKMLQFCIGAPVDGLWGAVTDAHLETYLIAHTPAELIVSYRDRRIEVYKMMAGFRYFGNDWLNRANEICRDSLGHR